MTNPNNAIGTNGAFGGRTSVNAFNDNLSAWTRGVMSGWACEPDSGMTVALGGDSSVRDVAIAEDDAGNKTTINNISLAPVQVTIPGAPASNTRIDSIVAYVDNPPQGSATITDNYESCGIIVVSGTATSSPVPPNDSAIRSAITADGATGATAYYIVLANVSVANGTTDITSGEIMAGDVAQLSGTGVVTANNVDFTTMKGYSSALPKVAKTNTIATFEGTPLDGVLTRYGDLVFLSIDGIISSTVSHDESDFGYINAGFRPLTESTATGNMVAGGSQNGSFSLRIRTNGNIRGSCPAVSSQTRVQVFGCWITGDAWPNS